MRTSMLKLASLGICCFLLWMTGAGAANGKQNQGRTTGRTTRHAAGSRAKGGRSLLLKDSTQGYCESDCCWATGDDVSCNNDRCTGSDSKGTAIYICNAI